MIGGRQIGKAVVTQDLGAAAHSALQPQTRAQRLTKEREEAIKLLSAEIMDAYGLCRPLANDECP